MKLRKISILLVVAILLSLFAVSCKKAEVVEVATFNSFNSISKGSAFKSFEVETDQIDEDGNIIMELDFKYAKRLDIGAPLVCYDITDTGSDDTVYTKLKSVDGEDFDNLWFRERYIVPEGKKGVVVTDDALVYSKANDKSITKYTLSRMMFFVAYPEMEGDFFKIRGWDKIQNKRRIDVYVKSSDVSVKSADVDSAEFYHLALDTDEKLPKNRLFETALKNTSSVFYDEIQFEYDKLNSVEDDDDMDDEGDMGEPAEYEFEGTINDDNVNVRAEANVDSSVVGSLDTGDTVYVIEDSGISFTNNEGTDSETTANWMKINNPSGYVYGIFIDP